MNFGNWCSGEVSKSAKIWISKLSFYVKNRRNLCCCFIEKYQFSCIFFFNWHFLITSIFELIYFTLKWCPIFDSSLLHQFSKFNNFLWVCWFLGKNLSNFVSLSWKINNWHYHIVEPQNDMKQWSRLNNANSIWKI